MIGIDLGTTHSLVAYFRDEQSRLILNAHGHALTPSAVSVDESGTVLVGLPARERHALAPQDSAIGFKRLMGTDQVYKLRGQKFRAEELSALVLKSLKADAEAELGGAIDTAVITVPAYFNQIQREATVTAARLAGLTVARLLNEPTAAGLAYGLKDRSDHTSFLIVDLGGGTFDVSVLEYFDGVVQVRASAGDTRLGGDDWSAALLDCALATSTAAERHRLRHNGYALRAAEQAKRALSDASEATLELPGMAPIVITRDQFHAASVELIAKLRRPIERALGDARLSPGELGEVVLVGGATRMPMVRQAITRLFGKLPLRTINPDETIAHGAAIQAALITRDSGLSEVVLTDVMPYTLGTNLVGDRYSPIIERNTPVPVSRVASYQTVEHQQAVLLMEILQGESPVASENLKLHQLEIKVKPLPAGEARIDLRLTYDANGLLVVDVHDYSTGRTHNAVVQQRQQALSGEALDRALAALAALKVHPREAQENRLIIERLKRLYGDSLGDARHAIQQTLLHFEQALDSQDRRIIDAARVAANQFLDLNDRGYQL